MTETADLNYLMVALISGSAAIVGSLGAQALQILQAHLSRKHQRDVLLREKYEEFAGCVAVQRTWLFGAQAAKEKALDRKVHPTASLHAQMILEGNILEYLPGAEAALAAAVQARVLASIYFPPMRHISYDYLTCMMEFRNLIKITGGNESISTRSLESILGEIVVRRKALEDAIVKHSDTYAKA